MLLANVRFDLFFSGAKNSGFYIVVKLLVLHANRRMGTNAIWFDNLLKGIVDPPIKSQYLMTLAGKTTHVQSRLRSSSSPG